MVAALLTRPRRVIEKAMEEKTTETTRERIQSGTSNLIGTFGRKASMLMKWVVQTPILNTKMPVPVRMARGHCSPSRRGMTRWALVVVANRHTKKARATSPRS